MIMWQLRELSTGKALSNPQTLPENWGPIFGLENFKDKLGNLSWVNMPDMGWFEVDIETIKVELTTEEKAQSINNQIAYMLAESVEKVMVDNLSLSKGELSLWIDYRNALREIPLQGGFPDDISWPAKP